MRPEVDKWIKIQKAGKKIAKDDMVRYLAEPINILAEPLGSAEPRLKNTALDHIDQFDYIN